MMDVVTRRVSSDRIIGRADELGIGRAALHSVLDVAPAVRVPLLLISGEAGIGKTRLLDELLDDARQRGGSRCAGGACSTAARSDP